MSIREKAISLVERKITKSGFVVDARAWAGNSFFEIDLHLPEATIENNTSVYHIKCRVAPFTFRDYTIAAWDAASKTCTLFIDAAHNGYGSAWTKALKKGDAINYMGIEAHRYYIDRELRHVFLGDQSAVGHFMALQRLAGDTDCIEGAAIVDNMVHRNELAYYYPDLHLQALQAEQSGERTLMLWLQKQLLTTTDVIYLAGNSHLVIELRKQLKANGHSSKNIKAQGFWK